MALLAFVGIINSLGKCLIYIFVPFEAIKCFDISLTSGTSLTNGYNSAVTLDYS